VTDDDDFARGIHVERYLLVVNGRPVALLWLSLSGGRPVANRQLSGIGYLSRWQSGRISSACHWEANCSM
jgi:hypothetical protein